MLGLESELGLVSWLGLESEIELVSWLGLESDLWLVSWLGLEIKCRWFIHARYTCRLGQQPRLGSRRYNDVLNTSIHGHEQYSGEDNCDLQLAGQL